MNARIDSLEPRVMLAVNAPVGVNLAYGLLTVTGTENADTINFGRLFIPLPFGLSIDWTTVEFNGVTKWYQTRTINRTLIRAGGGDDVINAATMPKAMTVYGGPGFDIIKTGEGNDSVAGEDGPASIEGNGGNDTLWGNIAVDVMRGGEGSDCLYGGAGNDELYGDGGNDSVAGDGENDLIRGGAGDDVLAGWYGDDSIYGDAGYDNLFGQSDNDCLYGGTEDDALDGGSGLDGLYGGFGIDSLKGGSGADRFLNSTTWPDTLDDFIAEDAAITFRNGFAEGEYRAGAWSESEIEVVDSALHVLHMATRNVKLLQTSSSGDLYFRRLGAWTGTGEGSGGWNSGGGNITMPDHAFHTARETREVVFHEVGHNWDEEYNKNLWNSQSGWIESLTDPSQPATPTTPAVIYLQSTDKSYWYLANALFVSNYSKYNPKEDFAECFTYYCMKKAGWTYSKTGQGTDIDSIPGKKQFIDSMIVTLSAP